MKERRQRALAELIRGNALSSQEELGERLSALGYAATQATISRDLEQIGAVKARRGGQLAYSLAEDGRPRSTLALDAVLRQWVSSVDTAMNMVVLKTPPGSAHLVGVALDRSGLPAIVGTICGDDTLFIACRSVEEANALAISLGQAGSA